MRKELSGIKVVQYMLCSTLILTMTAAASAAEITVRIFERGGKAALQGVAVCLGTSARLSQFGAILTDAEGYAVFSKVPPVQLLVTASRAGFMSGQERMSGSVKDRMLILSLPAGGGGVQCPLVESKAVSGTGDLKIESFRLNRGAAVTENSQVVLDNIITGQATQYRVSEHPDFHDAQWQAYGDKLTFQLSAGPGKKTVFFQVRRHALMNGAGIETRSRILRDSINTQF